LQIKRNCKGNYITKEENRLREKKKEAWITNESSEEIKVRANFRESW
jgi:hypothetical protein